MYQGVKKNLRFPSMYSEKNLYLKREKKKSSLIYRF